MDCRSVKAERRSEWERSTLLSFGVGGVSGSARKSKVVQESVILSFMD